MTPAQIKELEMMTSPAVKALLQEWKFFMESPYAETYTTIRDQITDWNEQLKIKEDEVRQRVIGNDITGNLITVAWIPGRVDLFADKDTKDFERVFKYFDGAKSLVETLDAIRSKMTPEEQRDAQKDKRLANNTGVAI